MYGHASRTRCNDHLTITRLDPRNHRTLRRSAFETLSASFSFVLYTSNAMTDLTSESKFTPAQVVDETKERDWPASLGT